MKDNIEQIRHYLFSNQSDFKKEEVLKQIEALKHNIADIIKTFNIDEKIKEITLQKEQKNRDKIIIEGMRENLQKKHDDKINAINNKIKLLEKQISNSNEMSIYHDDEKIPEEKFAKFLYQNKKIFEMEHLSQAPNLQLLRDWLDGHEIKATKDEIVEIRNIDIQKATINNHPVIKSLLSSDELSQFDASLLLNNTSGIFGTKIFTEQMSKENIENIAKNINIDVFKAVYQELSFFIPFYPVNDATAEVWASVMISLSVYFNNVNNAINYIRNNVNFDSLSSIKADTILFEFVACDINENSKDKFFALEKPSKEDIKLFLISNKIQDLERLDNDQPKSILTAENYPKIHTAAPDQGNCMKFRFN